MTMTTALDNGLAVGQCKSPLDLLAKCGGYYECPKGESGKRLGPLVAYRGTYGPDDDKKRFVGDVYVNSNRNDTRLCLKYIQPFGVEVGK